MLYFKAKGNVSNMTQENQFILSCYQHIADLNAARNIFIVQHKQTHKLYVMKVRKQYNKAVYLQLLQHHVPNTPELLDVLEDEEQLIVIEEYIAGRNLQEILDNNDVSRTAGAGYHLPAVPYLVRAACFFSRYYPSGYQAVQHHFDGKWNN